MSNKLRKGQRSYKWTYYFALALVVGYIYWITRPLDPIIETKRNVRLGSVMLHAADSMMQQKDFMNHVSDIRLNINCAILAFDKGIESAEKIIDYPSRHYYIDTCAKGRTNAQFTLSDFDYQVKSEEKMSYR